MEQNMLLVIIWTGAAAAALTLALAFIFRGLGNARPPRVPKAPEWTLETVELAPADDCPPEMPTADELCPHCVFQLTDNIFDWSLCKMLDGPLYVGNVSGKGRDVYVYAKSSETALQRLENARKQLMMEML